MRILLRVLFTLLCSWVCCQTALAGPNAGGTLILALSEGTAYSPDIDYCQSVTAASCEAAVYNTGSGYEGETVVLNCLAAFPVAGRLAGITFGVSYNPNSVAVIDYGACGDFELPDPSWPGPLSGTAVTWAFRRTEQLVPVYWFAAYSYNYAEPYSLTLRIHPTQGGNFADDSVPAVLDPIEGFGAFGFNDAGALPCPVVGEPTGACCFADGTCSVETEADCAAAGGSYQGNDTTCEPNPCDQPTGACCFADGSCTVQTAADCVSAGGSYQGNGTSCEPNPCDQPTGACCFADGSCTVQTAADCVSAGGSYQGNGTSCEPNPCDQPTGACCFADGSCTIQTAADCAAAGGSYQGNGTSCEPNPCDQPMGACCFADGSCSVQTEANCAAAGGGYQGDGTTCSPNPCDQPTGACCFADGSCTIQTAADCAAAGGSYQGNGTSCEPNPCDQPMGACCFADGTCSVQTEANCAAAGGGYQGDGTTCSPNPCDQPTGACCFADGSCSIQTEADCASAGGSYQGNGTDCDPNPCSQATGACCFPNRTCSVVTEAVCAAGNGDYHGDDSICDPIPRFTDPRLDNYCRNAAAESSCALEYWRNNSAAWSQTGLNPRDQLSRWFTLPSQFQVLADDTLEEALAYRPGDRVRGAARMLLRDAVVALLNARHPDVNFRLTDREIESVVNQALSSLDNATILAARRDVETPSDGYCPLR